MGQHTSAETHRHACEPLDLRRTLAPMPTVDPANGERVAAGNEGRPSLDASEYERWLLTAQEHLAAARDSAAADHGPAAVMLAEQAAQCGLKALLHGVGETQKARGRGLPQLVAGASEAAGLVTETAGESLVDLALDHQPSRYPDALADDTPMDPYSAARAGRAIADATSIVEDVQRAWASLLAADEDRDDGEDDA